MGRGVSSGGGQSSLGYLFGSDDAPKPAPAPRAPAAAPKECTPVPQQPPAGLTRIAERDGAGKAESAVPLHEKPAGRMDGNPNNYHRADGQNTGNFITDRPSTKVHSAPGGGSSLGYLFGGD